MVKAAAAFQAVSGIYLAASAIQMLMSGIVFYGELAWIQYATWMLVLAGCVQVFFAAQTIRMRALGLLAVPFSLVLALVVAGWVGMNVHFMIFSVMQLGTLCFSWSAAALVPFVLGPTRRAAQARRALEAEGLDLGI